jgi:hypothetical protein
MKRFAILSVAVVLCASALAGDREFDTIVRRVEARCDTSHTRIPFFGLANFVVKVVRPAGASDLKLAVFEDLHRPLFTRQEDFTDLMQGALGPDWRPFVRVQDRRNNEWTCIYSSISANHWKLLIATMERREATIVRIKLNPDGMMRWIEKPCHETRTWRRD